MSWAGHILLWVWGLHGLGFDMYGLVWSELG
jgi:hypothetical protein